ncbi:Divergent polysaccharide deacetylase [Rickettsiales bacterium Ac37b]|nr:Divergent polysaccharide deacetylase [Rickettsiales bacterium Ac37b]
MNHNNKIYFIIALLIAFFFVTFFIYNLILNTEYAKNEGLRVTFQLDSVVKKLSIKLDNKSKTLLTPNKQAVNISLPYLHIIIADAGLNAENTKKLLSLPKTTSIGLSPYGYNLPTLSKSFSNAGYNLLMYLPLEPINYPNDDAGNYALLRSMNAQEILQKLEFLVSRVENILGFYTMPKEQFTSSEEKVLSLLAFIKSKELLFVSNKGNINIQKVKESLDLTSVSVDLILDEDLSPEGINKQLYILEEILKSQGKAVIIGRAYPLTLEMLYKWIATLHNKNIILVDINEFITKTNNGNYAGFE